MNLDQVLKAFENALADDNEETKQARRREGEFHFIPLTMETFIHQLDVAVGLLSAARPIGYDGPIKFVDAGCGIGSKVIAAATRHATLGQYRIEAYGIEKDPRYVQAARKLVASPDLYWNVEQRNDAAKRIIQADLLTYKGFGKFDIIYFFCPLADPKKERNFEMRLIEQAHPGTLFLTNPGHDDVWRCEKVEPAWGRSIYRRRELK